MKHYIIDANNAIHKDAVLGRLIRNSPENARASFVSLVLSFASGYPSWKFSIVFDGKPSDLPPHPPKIKTIFSGEKKSADEIIKNLISRESKPAACVVVSSDNEIYNYAKLHSCTPLLSENFLKQLRNESKQSSETTKSSQIDNSEKPKGVSRKEIREMKKLFGLE